MALNPGPEGYLLVTRVVSGIGVLAALLCLTCGALQIHFVQYAGDVAQWPTESGSAMWLGVALLVTSILGIITSVCKPSMVTGQFRFVGLAHLVGTFATTSLSGTNLSYSITILGDWTRDLQMWFCVGDYPWVVAMAAMSLVLSVMVGTISVTLTVIYFMTRCAVRRMAGGGCCGGVTAVGAPAGGMINNGYVTNPGQGAVIVAPNNYGPGFAPPPYGQTEKGN